MNFIDIHKIKPSVIFLENDIFEVKNIRNIKYTNSEFENYKLEYLNETFDLKNLENVWFFEDNYAAFQSHIMLNFEFKNKQFLTVSVEVRKQSLKNFKIWQVLTSTQFVFYILGKPEDLICLRTDIRERKRNLYYYKLDLAKKQKEGLFISVLNSVKDTEHKNIIYKLFRTDCVNTLLSNFRNANIKVKKYFWDYSPTEVLYRSGLIDEKYIQI